MADVGKDGDAGRDAKREDPCSSRTIAVQRPYISAGVRPRADASTGARAKKSPQRAT